MRHKKIYHPINPANVKIANRPDRHRRRYCCCRQYRDGIAKFRCAVGTGRYDVVRLRLLMTIRWKSFPVPFSAMCMFRGTSRLSATCRMCRHQKKNPNDAGDFPSRSVPDPDQRTVRIRRIRCPSCNNLHDTTVVYGDDAFTVPFRNATKISSSVSNCIIVADGCCKPSVSSVRPSVKILARAQINGIFWSYGIF